MKKIGQQYSGFELIKVEHIAEINGDMYLYEHAVTKAQLVHIENDDVEKVFSIMFRTLPEDSTGIAHIMEHSTLCGSKKYPVKEPFVELMKGSLNSFLNAMTDSVMTLYPFATPNEKDYFNIMDVYMDAVFNPSIYTNKLTLMQEGWHYEVNDSDELTINGVVFNEMKGAMSSPLRVLRESISESLFDNCYKYNSGGDPDVIPQLTQAQFEAFHQKYYHPSNSIIFLYGDLNVDTALENIQNNFLSSYSLGDANIDVAPTKPFEQIKRVDNKYPLSPTDSTENKTMLAYTLVVDDCRNLQLMMSMQVLTSLLIEGEAAPLKRALLDSGIGQNVSGYFDESMHQPTFTVIIQGSEKQKAEQLVAVTNDTLKSLAEKGIDKKLLEASISKLEFSLREGSVGAPKGLIYFFRMCTVWVARGDIFDALRYEKFIVTLKEGAKGRYFEELIEQYLLGNTHGCLKVMEGEKGLEEKNEENRVQKLKEIKSGLTAQQLEEIKQNAKLLLEKQQAPDSKEALDTMPHLTLSDIGKEASFYEVESENANGVTLLTSEQFTSGIAYVTAMFDMSSAKKEQLPYCTLLALLLGKLNTKKHSFADLSVECDIQTGDISFASTVYENVNTREVLPYFEVSVKAVTEKVNSAFSLINEIITQTLFTDKGRIAELIKMSFASMQSSIADRGHQMAITRLSSYFSKRGMYDEQLKGVSYFEFLKSIASKQDLSEDIEILQKLAKQIFNVNGMMLQLTGDKEQKQAVKASLSTLLNGVNSEKCEKKGIEFTEEIKNEGLTCPAMVQYNAKGYDYKKLGYEYSGAANVARQIVGVDYLWNSVRVQGGAYGCFSIFDKSGRLMFCSYRDPNLKETFDVYDKTGEFFKNLEIDQTTLNNYIISAIAEKDKPLSSREKGAYAFSAYMSGITKEQIQKERDQILETTQAELRKMGDMFDALKNKNCITVFGNADKIKQNKKLFSNIINVL